MRTAGLQHNVLVVRIVEGATSMTGARVLILSAKSLMLHGILAWLAEQQGFEVMGLDVRAPHVNERIEEFCPDVIILDEDDVTANGQLTIAELMRHCPEAKVVKVDANTNIVSVVQQQRVAVADVADLLRLLTSG
jgi:chemotaxis response regulator CheB